MEKQRERLFEILSKQAQHTVPLNYRFIQAPPRTSRVATRLVESKPYRSKGYECEPYYKPISKCFRT